MTQLRRNAALLAIAAGLCFAAPPNELRSATTKDNPASKATASTLDVVPADALLMIAVRVGAYWDNPLNKAIRIVIEDADPGSLKGFRGFYGVAPEEVDQAVLFIPRQPGPYGNISVEPLFVIKTIKPFDKNKVAGPAAANAAEEINGRTLYRNKRGLAFTFLDDTTYLMGQAGQMRVFLKHKKTAKEGPLTAALKLAAEKHYIVAGLNTAELAATLPTVAPLPPELRPFKSLLKSKFATLTLDLDDQLRVDAKASFAKEADAKDGADAVNDALDLARAAFVQSVKRFSQDIDSPKLVALMKDAQAVLRATKAKQKGTTVEVEAALKIDPKATGGAVAEAAIKVREAARRIQISNDLKQLAIGMHMFNDSHGRLPAAAIYDKNGKPLLSWRVLLLPYIEQGELYKEFRLDEPWDSEHNKKLLAKMPVIFAPKDSEAYKNHETHFQAFVGNGTVFEPPANPKAGAVANGMALIDIPDGLSNTILFVEAKKAVPWTAPDDIVFDDGKLLPKVGGLSKGGFFAAICDGSVRFIPSTVKEEDLRTWIIRNSGKVRPDLDKNSR